MSPQRIQLRRTKGWRRPEGAIVVARPSKWGNPFKVGELVTPDHPGWITAGYEAAPTVGGLAQDFTPQTVDECVVLYGRHVLLKVGRSGFALSVEAKAELAGHDLACWCPLDQPCHADLLLEIANAS